MLCCSFRSSSAANSPNAAAGAAAPWRSSQTSSCRAFSPIAGKRCNKAWMICNRNVCGFPSSSLQLIQSDFAKRSSNAWFNKVVLPYPAPARTIVSGYNAASLILPMISGRSITCLPNLGRKNLAAKMGVWGVVMIICSCFKVSFSLLGYSPPQLKILPRRSGRILHIAI